MLFLSERSLRLIRFSTPIDPIRITSVDRDGTLGALRPSAPSFARDCRPAREAAIDEDRTLPYRRWRCCRIGCLLVAT